MGFLRKKEQTEKITFLKNLYTCIINAQCQVLMPKVNLRQHVAHTTDQLSSSGQTKAMPKNLSLNEEKSGGWASRQKKEKTERAIGVGRRT